MRHKKSCSSSYTAKAFVSIATRQTRCSGRQVTLFPEGVASVAFAVPRNVETGSFAGRNRNQDA